MGLFSPSDLLFPHGSILATSLDRLPFIGIVVMLLNDRIVVIVAITYFLVKYDAL